MYLKLKFEQQSDGIVSQKTMLYVGAIHVAFILVLYLSGIIQNFFWKTAPQAITVSLTSSAAYQEMSAMVASSSLQTQTQTQTQAQKQKKKTENAKQKEAKSVQKVPAKKTWKPLDITQITKPTETQIKEFKPVAHTTATNSVQGVSASALAANLKNSLSSVKFGASGTAQANPAMLTYYDSISSLLYERWEQPSKLAVSGAPPSVLVRLNIGRDGRLMDYQIIKNSNFAEMDDSVKRMLSTIDKLPPPPDGAMTIEATLILTN